MKPPIKIIHFLILATALTLVANFIPALSSAGNIKSLVIMWTPGLAALVVSLIHKRSLREIGWGFSLKWIALGWIIPVTYGSISYFIIWLTGVGEFPNPTFLERAQFTMGFESENSGLVILAAFFYITLVNLLPSMFLGLGEEIGWRGFLVPELFKRVDFKMTAIISGLIWAIWHLPGIIQGEYGESSTPLGYRLVCFFLLVISGAIILAWLRIKSGSIWPVAVFHATHNGVIQTFFDRLTKYEELTPYFAGEFGIVVPLISMAIALIFLKNSGTSLGLNDRK
ncbi:type II CAAX endopeptidase family protein [Algoriphagus sp. CAU 1675]|uniref:CPBP family intramembrane glutamic endopeptidase n=1 Tax=Algoriphagus sp. CAU 1675 TaxID=3032597 RepID=UPI0023D9E9B0|nr:type II CAAX endopeptidase family protein [Algoriphagus sp. CAU 1675]MDF2157051.1 type II CAAX endopeptidase family protein [Algoriphagus sp. CAU 1675]